MWNCNYCQDSVFQLDSQAIAEGWGRIRCDLIKTIRRDGPETSEVRSSIVLVHCPKHGDKAHDDLISKLARADYDLAGVCLKATVLSPDDA